MEEEEETWMSCYSPKREEEEMSMSGSSPKRALPLCGPSPHTEGEKKEAAAAEKMRMSASSLMGGFSLCCPNVHGVCCDGAYTHE